MCIVVNCGGIAGLTRAAREVTFEELPEVGGEASSAHVEEAIQSGRKAGAKA